MLFLALGAFYKHEPRAKYYDEFMKKKNEKLWNHPKLPKEEVMNYSNLYEDGTTISEEQRNYSKKHIQTILKKSTTL